MHGTILLVTEDWPSDDDLGSPEYWERLAERVATDEDAAMLIAHAAKLREQPSN